MWIQETVLNGPERLISRVLKENAPKDIQPHSNVNLAKTKTLPFKLFLAYTLNDSELLIWLLDLPLGIMRANLALRLLLKPSHHCFGTCPLGFVWCRFDAGCALLFEAIGTPRSCDVKWSETAKERARNWVGQVMTSKAAYGRTVNINKAASLMIGFCVKDFE